MSPVTDPPTPAERFALILEWLKKAVAAAIAIHMPAEYIVLIWNRISKISQHVTRVATLIKEGKYTPRQRSGKPRQKPTIRKPRQRSPYPRRAGWMLRLIPGVAGPRGWLETLLADPEMVALIAAAPELVRPIRSLCHRLLIPPPPVLALPRRPAPPPPVPPQAVAPAEAPRAAAAPDAAPQTAPPASPAPAPTAFQPPSPPANACGPPAPA